MLGPIFSPKDFASLNKTPSFASSGNTGAGILVSTHPKYLFVTALLWFGLSATCLFSWAGAWYLGNLFARWMGS